LAGHYLRKVTLREDMGKQMLSINEIISRIIKEVKYNNSNCESSILDLFDELFELETNYMRKVMKL